MSDEQRVVIEAALKAFEAKDTQGVLTSFDEEAVFYDPHYPQPEMRGRAAIAQGLATAFELIRQPGLHPRRWWEAGDSTVVEVDTHHVLANGAELRFPQVFVCDLRGGRVARLQVYGPYPPPAR